jgi:allophanate hydrolase
MPLPYSLALHQLSTAYAAAQLTPAQVMRDVCAVIDARGDDHVWIHRLSSSEVLAQVEAAEQLRAKGSPALPLFGIPFAIKDNMDAAGYPTTAGCPAFRYIARSTAHVVQRLIDAGAILIGKTNLDQFATGLVGTRSPYGVCANAFDPRYIAGGSSSGSAVAVAAGLVSFALGTDTAGSGRVPAAFNNIVGLKPTHGLLSARGVVPACRTLDCVSIFALTCNDAFEVFEHARGWDPQDAYSRRDTPSVAAATLGQGFRFGLPQPGQLEFFGDAEAERQFKHSVEILRALGGTPVAIDFAPFAETAGLVYQGPWVAERLAAIKDFFAAHADDMHPVTRQIIGGAQKYSAVDAFEASYRLQALRQRCAEAWGEIDVLAVPTTGTIYTLEEIAAEPIAHNTRLGYYTNFVNLLDLAAVAVPGGFRRDGLPAGITLIAPGCSESSLSVLGGRFHRSSGVPLGATGIAMSEDGPA